MNDFTYTDHRGVAWTAQFLETQIDMTEVADLLSGSADTFTIGAKTYPTTTRQKGIWATRLVMEVTGV